jgi:hypothetical protein
MSSPKDHHYVPKVYLREFSNSQQQLFQVLKGKQNISVKTISQVCYKTNYFKLHSTASDLTKGIKDHNHIEKNVFKKQENTYSKLVKKVTFPSLTQAVLKKSEALLFLETLMTIKRRNPAYRQHHIEAYKEYITSEQFRKDAEPGLEIAKRIDKIDPVAYFENFVKEATTDTNKQSDYYLQGFLDKENKIIKFTAQTLMHYKLYMYHAPFGSEFITSDNPGFTTMPDGSLYQFGGFGREFTFTFPLTPKSCLFISYKHLENDPLSLDKNIHIIHTDRHFVNAVNEGTFKLATNKIFSYSKETLVKTIDNVES